jgi:type IV secretion system protein VirB6
MFLPIGSFLTRMDAALSGSMDGIIAAMTSAMATPIAAAAIVYYAVQGLRLANGDSTPLQNFVPQLIRVGTVIWLSSNLSAFNQWVRDVFFTGLPNALGVVIANSTGATGNSLSATAAIFDNIWSQIWIVVGSVWAQAGFSTAGAITALAGVLAAIFGTLGLVYLALVYVCARMVLAVIVCLAPAIIGCAMFDATRPIFERATGKIIALILLQTTGLIVMQIVLMGDQWFIAQLTTASINATAGGSALSDELQVLVALVVWFVAGAFTMYNLPAVAYSIGSGVAISGPPLLLWYHLMRSLGGGGSNGGAEPSPPPSLPTRDLGLSLAPLERAGGHGDAVLIPPPPPPSIATSTRR